MDDPVHNVYQTWHGAKIYWKTNWFLGAGMVVMAIPIFTSKENKENVGDNVASRTEYYTTAKNLLVSGADAMERLMTAYKVYT